MSLSNKPSFRLMTSFLRPVTELLDDESVGEVMVDPDEVLVERGGRLERVADVALDPKHVRVRPPWRSPATGVTTSAASAPCWMLGCRTASYVGYWV
ncbi:MAG: hypothetical protein OXN96_01220 [Bryobacterales bacterium]|nr:hypothetical protein [Bryobacterales bacterium]